MGQLARKSRARGSGTGQGLRDSSPRETRLDGRKAAMAAAARHQRMRGVVWIVAALRRHAGSRHGTPRQKTGHPKRMPGDDRRLVVLCWGTAQDGVVLWNTLPQAVYVKFDTAGRLADRRCSREQCVTLSPLARGRGSWIAKGKIHNFVVSRTQFPLAPAFAITAHVAQGQTIHRRGPHRLVCWSWREPIHGICRVHEGARMRAIVYLSGLRRSPIPKGNWLGPGPATPAAARRTHRLESIVGQIL